MLCLFRYDVKIDDIIEDTMKVDKSLDEKVEELNKKLEENNVLFHAIKQKMQQEKQLASSNMNGILSNEVVNNKKEIEQTAANYKKDVRELELNHESEIKVPVKIILII